MGGRKRRRRTGPCLPKARERETGMKELLPVGRWVGGWRRRRGLE